MTSFFRATRCLIPCAALLAAPVAATTALSDAELELTGGASREWVLAGSKAFMGGGCAEGEEVDVFASDHKLTVTSCLKGQSSTTTHSWTTYQKSPLDQVLVVDGQSFLLLFRKEGAHHLMRLRTPAPSQTEPTVDRDFRLED